MNYSTTPAQEGAFEFSRTGSAGYQNFSQGIPWYHGRSQIATIPEWQRNPWMLANDLVMNIKEGRSHLLKYFISMLKLMAELKCLMLNLDGE